MKPHSLIILAMLLSPFALAEPNNQQRTLQLGLGIPESERPWQSKFGIGSGVFPEYEGSDAYKAVSTPLIDIHKPGVFFIKGGSINHNNGLGGTGLTLLHLKYSNPTQNDIQLSVGPLIRAYEGRNQNDSEALEGLSDIDRSISVGGFIELYAGNWKANLSASPQEVAPQQDGVLATLDIEYTLSVNQTLALTTLFSTSWADDDYMQRYFGVTRGQTQRSKFDFHDANAGIKDTGIQLHATYNVSPHWSVEAQAGYWRMLNDAANSPLVEDAGTTNQVRGLLGLSYRF